KDVLFSCAAFIFGLIGLIEVISKMVLESQRLDKNKEGLGYSAVPPPPAQVYSPPKKDLSWTRLPEFADDIVTNNSRPAPTVESSPDDAQNRNPFVTATEASPNTITPKTFIKFVKATDRSTEIKTAKDKTAKPAIKYAAIYNKPSKRYCNEFNEMFVVYENISGGDLAKRLHKVNRKSIQTPLSCVESLKICIRAARALDYLHNRIIHRDVKSSNILLDRNMAAKAVLLEILCRRPAVDPSFGDNELGLTQPKDRPTMSEVVVDLRGCIGIARKRGVSYVKDGSWLGKKKNNKDGYLKKLYRAKVELVSTKLKILICSLDNLKVVTRNFSDDMVVGEGAFAKIFK
nr:hypothetical protein [Tanacetum cinerariifolium]